MRNLPHAAAEVALARPVVHSMLESPRPWIREGLAAFAQALIRERQSGRRAALTYLGQFSSALAVAEAESHGLPEAESQASSHGSTDATPPPVLAPQPLITTADEVFFRTKAAYVWWMLRDMVGDHALQAALAHYQGAEDRNTAYMQRLIETQDSPKRDLEAFFDDWVYRDRGLPQLRVASAYARRTLGEQTVTAVTVENLSEVWCEVPVTVRSPKGENTARVVVPGKAKATVRVSLEADPTEAHVNDGSIPEAERGDNVIPVTVAPPVEH
jgi:aminopeptidase N